MVRLSIHITRKYCCFIILFQFNVFNWFKMNLKNIWKAPELPWWTNCKCLQMLTRNIWRSKRMQRLADKFSFKNSSKKEACETLIMFELIDVNCCCYFINEQGEDTETSMDWPWPNPWLDKWKLEARPVRSPCILNQIRLCSYILIDLICFCFRFGTTRARNDNGTACNSHYT